MNCVSHVLGIRMEHHAWHRRVTATESRAFPETSIWGRPITNDHVFCHAEFVCERCGAVRDDGDCGCDEERGSKCPIRLEYLAKVQAQSSSARA